MNQLSVYILTRNSEKYLAEILEKLAKVADEILVIDSGSTDKTEQIARNFGLVRFVVHELKDFKTQRLFAEAQCLHNRILFLDSDEIPDEEFIHSIMQLKKNGFAFDAYEIKRFWKVLGKDIHTIYPIISPDFPIRLYDKTVASFNDSQLVHETVSGYKTLGEIGGNVTHNTFETREELNRKLHFYTDIAAQDLILKQKKVNTLKLILNPIAAFIKWYFIKGGFKDGFAGIILAKYAYDYTRFKYKKAQQLIIEKLWQAN